MSKQYIINTKFRSWKKGDILEEYEYRRLPHEVAEKCELVVPKKVVVKTKPTPVVVESEPESVVAEETQPTTPAELQDETSTDTFTYSKRKKY